MSLTSTLILGTKPEPATLLEIQEKGGVVAGTSINLMVFETSFKDKKIYAFPLREGAHLAGQADPDHLGESVVPGMPPCGVA